MGPRQVLGQVLEHAAALRDRAELVRVAHEDGFRPGCDSGVEQLAQFGVAIMEASSTTTTLRRAGQPRLVQRVDSRARSMSWRGAAARDSRAVHPRARAATLAA